jgi:LysM repeat protein
MKARLPKLILRRKKLRAATARRSSPASGGMDYGDMAEPNMKLSRALLIVLLLHVVAVSGIIAFNAIKTRQGSSPPAALGNRENDLTTTSGGSAINDDALNPKPAVVPRNEAKTSHSVSKTITKEERAKPIQDEKTPVSSGKIYTVVKGDNPVTIAKKLNVPYSDLMEINHIQDPRKLQIGQKLMVPKTTKQKKNER